MTRFLALVLAMLLAIPAAAPALAHQQKVTITTVEHNARTGLLEVVHQIPLHDAEHALRRQGVSAADIVANPESRSAFAAYVTDRFTIMDDGEPIALTILGSQIDGGNLVIYQEAASPGIGAELLVRSLVLTDIWVRQTNRVNVGPQNSPTTLIFRAGDAPKTVTLQ